MEKIETIDDYKEVYFRYKKCDHGRAIFVDGEQKEFGFMFPTFQELRGFTLFEYLEWYVSSYFRTKKSLKKVNLSA